MSDIYNTKTYTFAELSKKNGGFRVPTAIIKVGGKDITKDMSFCISGVSVTQTIKAKSGSCRFTVVNAYDLKSGGFKSGFDGSFPLGEKVEVYLGYITPEIVFKGFIGDVAFSFSEGASPSATISCFDVRTLMMQGRKNVMLEKAQFETVVKELLSYYSSLIEFKNECKDTHNKEESFNQNTSDFDYINSYARKRGYDFFVLGDKAYLMDTQSQKDPLLELAWGESLLSFSYNYSYNCVKIEGAMTDYANGDPLSENAQTQKPSYKQVQLTSEPVIIRFDAPLAKNPDDLKLLVEGEKKRRENEAKSGSAKCIGIPQLIPGRFVSLKNLDEKMLNCTLFVSEVTHDFSTGGYTTTLDFSYPSKDDGAGELLSGAKKASGQLGGGVSSGSGSLDEGKKPFVVVRKVVDNKYDDENLYCVKLDIPMHEGTTDFVRVAMPFASKGYGAYFLPDIGDEVIVVYCEGDIDKPLVIGRLYNKANTPPPDIKDDENLKSCIKTKSGHLVLVDDTKDKTSIEIKSAGGAFVKVDDEAKTITISDSKGENKLIVNEKDGELSLLAKNKISLTCGTSTLTLDGKGKSSALTGDTVDIKPSKALNLSGQQQKIEGQQLKIKGQTVNVEAGGQLEVKSSGVLNLKGSMVKLN